MAAIQWDVSHDTVGQTNAGSGPGSQGLAVHPGPLEGLGRPDPAQCLNQVFPAERPPGGNRGPWHGNKHGCLMTNGSCKRKKNER